MKDIKLYIDLECVEPNHGVEAILVGLAAERKNHKAIIKLVRKLAEKDLQAVCEHQPIHITKRHGEFFIRDSHNKTLFGRERKIHSSTHHHHGKKNK